MVQQPGSDIAVIAAAPLPDQRAPRSVPGRIIEQVHQGLDGADETLRALEEAPDAGAGDYQVDMRPIVTCSGETPGQALAKASAWFEKAPTARLEALGFRYITEPGEPAEVRLTLALSYPDEDDEE
ncbi:hypothetical protein [Streptacidiphilus carbonis]|uniref:hypothetical protein n=1 Tax=Streptacidiphilus carbonis TaxID=105422 RepID=UPI0005A95058|nr:hypothetical protein [Streptacidiphilus carbonis]